jgi:hypothetical protein
MNQYDYPTTDFKHSADPFLLWDEIAAVVQTTLQNIETFCSVVRISFADSIMVGEQAELDWLIRNHVPFVGSASDFVFNTSTGKLWSSFLTEQREPTLCERAVTVTPASTLTYLVTGEISSITTVGVDTRNQQFTYQDGELLSVITTVGVL